jgi:hypothetical protein
MMNARCGQQKAREISPAPALSPLRRLTRIGTHSLLAGIKVFGVLKELANLDERTVNDMSQPKHGDMLSSALRAFRGDRVFDVFSRYIRKISYIQEIFSCHCSSCPHLLLPGSTAHDNSASAIFNNRVIQ